ncbi:MAG: GAF domain-containing protein [Candidatus Eremiobacteraeota bacterium]|nr:GAF domain-containing protein [Candidatus Eremiobacteraeota bacterium]
MGGVALKTVSYPARLRAYAIALATAALVVVFAIAESLTERYVSEHSRLAGTSIELAIVALAALAFSPLHKRVETWIEAAFTKRRREAREALLHLRRELPSFNEVPQILTEVVAAVDRHMSAAGCAVYLWRGAYVAEASSFDAPLEPVALNDALTIRLRSSSLPADPHKLGSTAAGNLAFPMMARGELVGFLTLAPKRIHYEGEDLHALGALAEATGFALVTLDSELRLHAQPRTNLPQLVKSFVGREKEVGDIEALLSEHRLVTLTGAGGVGKTSIALKIGTDLLETFADGVWMADFAPLSDAALVGDTVLRALNLPQSGKRKPLDTVVGYVKRKQMLLVLDNCEHVVEEARAVCSSILRDCPGVRIVTTSREALAIAGEEPYRMPSLDVTDATKLFAERARSSDKRFTLTDDNASDVADICRRLDGIPLAIELAAARIKILSPRQLVEKLNERFRVLTGGDRSALPRHQTMRALIDWSYDLLSETDRALFRKLSIFAGGCTLQTAAAVCSDDADEVAVLEHLTSLVDKSLLQTEPAEGGMRYYLLESTRQYARERLAECGEEEATMRAHAVAFAALADELSAAYETSPDTYWDTRSESELENWRAALSWAFGPVGDVTLGQHLAAALKTVWFRYAGAEGRRWVHQAFQLCDENTDEALVASLEYAEARLEDYLHHYRASHDLAERALARYERLGDARGIAQAQTQVGFMLLFMDRLDEGEALLWTALDHWKTIGRQKTTGWIWLRLAMARMLAGDADGARRLFAEAQSIATGSGGQRLAAAVANERAELEFRGGDAATAARLVGDAIQTSRLLHDAPNLVTRLLNSAAYAIALGRYDEARRSAREALTLGRDLQNAFFSTVAVQHVAAVAALRPAQDPASASVDRALAARLLGYADARLTETEVHREYTEQREFDAVLSALRETLGDDVQKLMAEGAAWNEEHAIDEAMRV